MAKKNQYKIKPHKQMDFDFEDGWLVFYYDGKKYQTDLPDFERESFVKFIKPLKLDEILRYALWQKNSKKRNTIGVKINKNKKVVFKFFDH